MPGAIVERGDRVTLRTREPEDAGFLQRGLANPELRHPIGNPVVTAADVEAGLEGSTDDEKAYSYLVCLDGEDAGPGVPGEGEVTRIGYAGASDVDWRRPDLGYWIAPEYQGQGYGTEAVTLLVDHVFARVDAAAVGAVVYDFNEASRGLLESLGFVEEGVRRKERFIDGAYRDTIQYGILREEWEDGDE